MNTKKLTRILIVLLFGMIIMFGVLAGLYFHDSNFEFSNYLSSLSGFFVAILTLLYVFTTTKQLEAMDKQLKQMERDSKLKGQPFPCLNNLRVEIEPPRFFYTPPLKEYNFFSRFDIVCDIENLTAEPAINLCLFGKVIIIQKEEKKELYSFGYEVDTISGKETKKELSLMSPMDLNGELFDALRESASGVYINLTLLYRNITGGYFSEKRTFEIYVRSGPSKEIMKHWHEKIILFPVKYKEEVERLIKIRETNRGEWEKIFKTIKDTESLGDEKLSLHVSSNISDIEMKVLEKEEWIDLYKKERDLIEQEVFGSKEFSCPKSKKH